MSKKRREKRESTARRRASQKKSGFSTTKFQLPEGLGFWDFKDDVTRIDIVPYIVGKGNPWAKEGELHYERTYYQYRAKIGAEQKKYIALGETFGVRDPIQEYRNEKSRQVPKDKTEEDELNALVKDLSPSERQLFLIYDHNQEDKGVQLFDFSYHMFGKLLDKRIDTSEEEEGWDAFYFPDEEGFTLKITWENEGYGPSAAAIDFIPRREPLPEEIVNHGYCLDDMLVQTPYEKLYAIFHHQQIDDDSAKNEDATGSESNTKQDSKTATQDEVEPKKSKSSESKSTRMETKSSSRETEESSTDSEKKSPSKSETQESPFKRLDVVEYEGKKCTIMKISGDGTSHTLVDEDDEMIKAVSADEMKPWKEKKEKPKQEEEKEPEEDEAPFGDKDDENPWDDDF